MLKLTLLGLSIISLVCAVAHELWHDKDEHEYLAMDAERRRLLLDAERQQQRTGDETI